ncbi:hypothetical protein [Streptomyces eurocidicus]|uniref:Uncharacterized protein n=1 Tax=Streptomyces eurocidicus TaxID=66423 RepID=A0A7W8B4H0_STREU|nr:hypothetical protein [Streptomyces eurocidicus]MBB5116620.1 hypothetical protein [Streptomyces eurocidicus]MBF6052378.1 hypothetical protein [Streptomyces eurocidicus]
MSRQLVIGAWSPAGATTIQGSPDAFLGSGASASHPHIVPAASFNGTAADSSG